FSGVGYAVPADIIAKIVPALIKDGQYPHPWLGISGRTLTPDIREAMDLEPNQPGILVITVTDGGPADKAGLQGSETEIQINGLTTLVGGDVITGIDNQDIREFDDLLSYLVENTVVGQDVTLQILRSGETIQLDVTLAERPTTNL
ncbi:MAG: PDZ domain-containing protein, partial [Anaerolineales bacterium]